MSKNSEDLTMKLSAVLVASDATDEEKLYALAVVSTVAISMGIIDIKDEVISGMFDSVALEVAP